MQRAEPAGVRRRAERLRAPTAERPQRLAAAQGVPLAVLPREEQQPSVAAERLRERLEARVVGRPAWVGAQRVAAQVAVD